MRELDLPRQEETALCEASSGVAWGETAPHSITFVFDASDAI